MLCVSKQVALLSKKTRQLTTIPEDWKIKYSSAVVENERLVVMAEKVPASSDRTVAQYDLQVRWNDTDLYKHTNYLSYVKFCFDAAQDAVANGKYSAFHEDILMYRVKAIESLYKAESRANDRLTIFSWEDDKDPYKLHFSMQKADGSIVHQCRVEFYQPDNVL